MKPIEDEELSQNQRVVYNSDDYSDDLDDDFQDADGDDEEEFEEEDEVLSSAEGDDDIDSFDFSEYSSIDAKRAINRIHRKLDARKSKKRKRVKKLKKKKSNPAQIITPSGKKINVKDISKVIIGNSAGNKLNKQFGMRNGKKLKLLIFTFDNTNSAIDFNFSLFDPSQPLDYFMATGQDINQKILVSGGANGNIQYSDVLFNILANPTLIYQAKFTFAGVLYPDQSNEPLQIENKDIDGKYVIKPIQTLNLKDTFQVQGDIVNFDIQERLPYTFIPDGMDTMRYRVLPGMTVTFAFAFRQISIKDRFFGKEIKSDQIKEDS
jgi:hypothetical protein